MKCPTCGSHQVFIIDSREVGDDKRRRRYECYDCKDRFTTYEINVGDVMTLNDMRNEARFNAIEDMMKILEKEKEKQRERLQHD